MDDTRPRRGRRRKAPLPEPAPALVPDGKPTLRTIAQMTGLAVTTISRALNNAPELATDTRERVQRIATAIGYVPDRTALRLKTGRTNVISLILDPHDEILGFGQSMVSGLTEALRGTAYHIVITPNFRNVEPIEPIRHIVRNRMADGVIFSRTEPGDERVKYLQEHHFCFVSHGRTELPSPHAYVDYDNEVFAYHAVRRLAARGRRHVAIVLPPSRFTFAGHLRSGFMRGIAETGLRWEIDPAMTLDDQADAIREAAIRRLSRPDPPDGFICPGDAAALAVMAGISDRGLAIGTDVDIVAKQTSEIFSQVRPRVDAIYEDMALAGRQMGELLLRAIAGEPPDRLQILHVPDVRW
ncbi:MAG TPA: LacI family transcriptional regulator [Devosiaceae bacterium]|nr:LacI family transcriptional regulator [Devosiaceae bacterium]